jgi:hypothetical protein
MDIAGLSVYDTYSIVIEPASGRLAHAGAGVQGSEFVGETTPAGVAPPDSGMATRRP